MKYFLINQHNCNLFWLVHCHYWCTFTSIQRNKFLFLCPYNFFRNLFFTLSSHLSFPGSNLCRLPWCCVRWLAPGLWCLRHPPSCLAACLSGVNRSLLHGVRAEPSSPPEGDKHSLWSCHNCPFVVLSFRLNTTTVSSAFSGTLFFEGTARWLLDGKNVPPRRRSVIHPRRLLR